jgi:ketosteroid isomerase-like protein
VDETALFLADVLPHMQEADTSLHSGDARGRIAMWSQVEPVTLFGAVVTINGWTDIRSSFEWLATTFSNCESFTIDVIAAGASGDLAYIAASERVTTSVNERPPGAYTLRVTTIFRRENGAWKVVHRHGDPLTDDAAAIDTVRRLAREAGRS